jgi:hypothetical protein
LTVVDRSVGLALDCAPEPQMSERRYLVAKKKKKKGKKGKKK